MFSENAPRFILTHLSPHLLHCSHMTVSLTANCATHAVEHVAVTDVSLQG